MAVDLYKAHRIDLEAEPAVIEAVYKRLACKYHPNTNSSPEAAPRMQEINAVYAALGDLVIFIDATGSFW
jgi:DnaJ-class molecular chaperone